MLPFFGSSQRKLVVEDSDDDEISAVQNQDSDSDSVLATFSPHDTPVESTPAKSTEPCNNTNDTEDYSDTGSLDATVNWNNVNDDEEAEDEGDGASVISQHRRSTRAREMVKKLVQAQLTELKAHLPDKVYRQHAVRVNCLQNMVLTALRRVDEQKEKMEEQRRASEKELVALSNANTNLVQEVEVMEQETNQVKQELVEACKVIDSLSDSLRERNQELVTAQELVEELESQISELDNELQANQNRSTDSALQVEARQNVLLANARSEIDELKTERDDYKAQLEFYKKRCAKLEKTPSLMTDSSRHSTTSSKGSRFWRFGKNNKHPAGPEDEFSDMSSHEGDLDPKDIDLSTMDGNVTNKTIEKLMARIEKLEGGKSRDDATSIPDFNTTYGGSVNTSLPDFNTTVDSVNASHLEISLSPDDRPFNKSEQIEV